MLSNIEDHIKGLIKEIDLAAEQRHLLDDFKRQLARFGYESFLITRLPFPGETLKEAALAIHWPANMLEKYCSGRYEQDDPVFWRCRRAMFPFTWTISSLGTELNPRGYEILRIAKSCALNKGYAIPIHGPDGYKACVRISGNTPDTSHHARVYLHILSLTCFERLLKLKQPHRFYSPLTGRENEVLQLVALGRSAKEISTILSISKRTVDEHAANATRKLGAENRTHAVAIAIQSKIISI